MLVVSWFAFDSFLDCGAGRVGWLMFETHCAIRGWKSIILGLMSNDNSIGVMSCLVAALIARCIPAFIGRLTTLVGVQ